MTSPAYNRHTQLERGPKLGVLDFIRDAGAKIGLGDDDGSDAVTTDANESAASKARIQESLRKARAKRQEMADDAKKEAERAAKAAAMEERRAEAAKSRELERYLDGLGFPTDDLDIRFDDGVAYLEGEVDSQETRQKIILAVGNVAGVEKVDEEIEVVEPAPENKTYTVVKGDTLSKIAKEFYGDASKYPVIFEANKPMLKDPNLIYPGQVLVIPEA